MVHLVYVPKVDEALEAYLSRTCTFNFDTSKHARAISNPQFQPNGTSKKYFVTPNPHTGAEGQTFMQVLAPGGDYCPSRVSWNNVFVRISPLSGPQLHEKNFGLEVNTTNKHPKSYEASAPRSLILALSVQVPKWTVTKEMAL